MFGFLKKKTTERRRLERLPMPERLAQMVVRSVQTKERIHVRLIDVSERGVRFAGDTLDGVLNRGDEIEIQLNTPAGGLLIHGQVVWSKAAGGGRDYEGGIAFDPLPARKQESLGTFIEHVRTVIGYEGKRVQFPDA